MTYCGHPPTSCNNNGDLGVRLTDRHESGYPTPEPTYGAPKCRMLSIHGWGSSTYNSPIFNGVASATAPIPSVA